jgi:hypothetical protein
VLPLNNIGGLLHAMNVDPAALGLTWKDGMLIGIIIGQWLNARGRVSQGQRIGRLEELLAALKPKDPPK